MGIITTIAQRLKGLVSATPDVVPQERSTGFSAAEYSRITSSMVSESRHINSITRWEGRTLRARSRQLCDNNEYAAKFLGMVTSNVCGPNPFRLQAKTKTATGRNKGLPDSFANEKIEAEWNAWGRPGSCDFSGRLSWPDFQRLIIRTVAMDGEALIRVLQGNDCGPWGIKIQLIDTNRLDEDRNQQFPDGSAIHCGIEFDPQGKVVAYWLMKQKVSDWQAGYLTRQYERIPAEEIIHLFIPQRAEQVRGVPWMSSIMIKLAQLSAFEEAAVIAARVGAAKMGFFERNPELGGNWNAETDTTGAKITDAEPGTFEELPAGLKFSSWDPRYPDAQVEVFIKAALRGIASGLNVPYHELGNNLEGVNFSSARAGLLEAREIWMGLQTWFIEHFHNEIYQRWLFSSIALRRLPFDIRAIDKYRDITWQPRRWAWVDPVKDVEANILAIKWGLKSRTQVITEQGLDIEDVFDQLSAESALAASKNVEITPIDEQPVTTGGAPDEQPTE